MKDLKKLANDLLACCEKNVLTKDNADAVFTLACEKEGVNPDDIIDQLTQESTEDAKTEEKSVAQMINEFLEACAECDPAKNVENEITEKLPVETPNEDPRPADDPSIEKIDKAIEDAKKPLDVAAKLAEMKAKHEAEKDTTEQHEEIKQALESEDSVKAAKLNIYEACDAGIITAEEKADLLEMLKF